jgi:hypothetical protein
MNKYDAQSIIHSTLEITKNRATFCVYQAILALIFTEIFLWFIGPQWMGLIVGVISLCFCSASYAFGSVISKIEESLHSKRTED